MLKKQIFAKRPFLAEHMVDMHKLPIDDHFDEPFANQIAKLEAYNKHHYRPNSYLHKWWARRCGSTFRLILKHLVEDKTAQDYYAPGGLRGKRILDPMMGGGTTLHEAIRLGATVLGADLDPIPVLQARATLTDVPLPELETAFASFFKQLRGEISPYFMTMEPETSTAVPIWYTLYGLRRACACGEVIIVDSLALRQEQDGTVRRLDPCSGAVYTGDARSCEDKRPFIIEKSQKSCSHCKEAYEELMDVPYYGRYVPLVIAGRGTGGALFFKAVTDEDKATLAKADAQRNNLPFDRAAFDVAQGRKTIQLHQRGVSNYLDLFSSRQLLYLEAAMRHLPNYTPLERLNLGLLVSTSLEFHVMLSGYKGKGKRRSGAIRHAFAHHAYAFPYTALENNPIYPRKASGTLQKLFQGRIRNGRRWANTPKERDIQSKKARFVPISGERDAGVELTDVVNGHHKKDAPGKNGKQLTLLDELPGNGRSFWLHQGSSIDLPLPDDFVDAIVTDPPYYDSVQYSDLSAFFRVWLRCLLPDGADWQVDVRESAVDPHKLDRESRYRELMTGIFVECRRVLKEENGRLIFTFHHWNPKAWIALSHALKEADFQLINRYVVFSENPISVHINKMKALLHDVILVLGPRGESERKEWERPTAVNLQESESFCRDCGTLLGVALQPGTPTDAIESLWLDALREE